MVWSPHSFPRPGRCHLNPFPAGLRVPTQGRNYRGLFGAANVVFFTSSLADQSRILCWQVSAQSSARPLGKSFVLCKLLSQGKGRLCAPGLCSVLPSQHHAILKALFRPSCKEQDKSNIKVYQPCTAALKLHPEEETDLPCCRGPSTRGLGQKRRL